MPFGQADLDTIANVNVKNNDYNVIERAIELERERETETETETDRQTDRQKKGRERERERERERRERERERERERRENKLLEMLIEKYSKPTPDALKQWNCTAKD